MPARRDIVYWIPEVLTGGSPDASEGGRRDEPPAPCTGSGSAAWVSEATTERRGWTKLNCKPPTKIGSGLRRAGPLQFRQADMEGWMADRTVAPCAVV